MFSAICTFSCNQTVNSSASTIPHAACSLLQNSKNQLSDSPMIPSSSGAEVCVRCTLLMCLTARSWWWCAFQRCWCACTQCRYAQRGLSAIVDSSRALVHSNSNTLIQWYNDTTLQHVACKHTMCVKSTHIVFTLMPRREHDQSLIKWTINYLFNCYLLPNSCW